MKINHILIALAALAAAACTHSKPQPITIDSAKTFPDSVSIAVGNRLGMVALYDLMQNVPESIDKEEMWRGAMSVMDVDTANISYIYGIATGELLMRNYMMLAARTHVNKDLYLKAAKAIFMQDSLPTEAELQEAVKQYELVFDILEAQEKAAADAQVYASDEAAQNRILNEMVEQKLKADPAYQPIGNAGIMGNVVMHGDGVALAPEQYVTLDFSLSRIDSGSPIVSKTDVMIPVSNCYDPVIASLLPHLTVGETATFYVPYTLAYGVQGYPSINVGPCESVLASVTVKSVK